MNINDLGKPLKAWNARILEAFTGQIPTYRRFWLGIAFFSLDSIAWFHGMLGNEAIPFAILAIGAYLAGYYWPLASGWCCVTLFAIGESLSFNAPLSLVCSFFATLYSWAATGRLYHVTLGAILGIGFTFASTGKYPLMFSTFVLIAFTIITTGLTVGRLTDTAIAAQDNAKQSAQHELNQTLHNVSVDLHDRSAAILGHIVIMANNIQADLDCDKYSGEPFDKLREDVHSIEKQARSASTHLRSTIQLLRYRSPHSGQSHETISETRDAGINLLLSCSLIPKVHLDPGIFHSLSPEAQAAAASFIRECCTNAAKYALRKSTVTLEADDECGFVKIASMNRCELGTKFDDALTSHHGLSLLSALFSNQGGSIDVFPSPSRWLIIGKLPKGSLNA